VKFFFIIILLIYTLYGFSQSGRMTIHLNHTKIETILKEIEKQSGYRFFYDVNRVKVSDMTDVAWNAVGLSDALGELFDHRGITFRFMDKQIVLFPTTQNPADVASRQHFVPSKPPSGAVHGMITDAASGQGIPYATVITFQTNPPVGTTTDESGYFRLNNLPVGRHDIQCRFIGYESAIFKDVMVSSGKEVFLAIDLRENVQELEEVTVRPKINKEAPLNAMASASARMFSVEEASRYAGGFDDPARLVTAFAGVAGIINNNGVAIRGNSPQFLQWRIEGVEAVNPTHFSDMTGIGGGIITAFSAQTLNNSDFITGAFPAEYGNSLSGVFDMQLRNGNNQHYEHTAQFGMLGIELSSEGPLKKGKPASYLFNYRYSSIDFVEDLLAVLVPDMTGLNYQDLSFKMNFPTKRVGTFSVWGVGLINHYRRQAEENKTQWIDIYDKESGYEQTKAIGGMGHKILINEKSYLKSALAVNVAHHHSTSKDRIDDGSALPVSDMKNTNWNITFNTYLNTKHSIFHTNRTGLSFTGLFHNIDYLMSPDMHLFPPDEMVNYVKDKGSSMALSAFSQSSFRLNNNIIVNVGLHGDYFRLINRMVLEPRAGIRWQVFPSLAFGLAYGKHSRRENTDYYFVKTKNTANPESHNAENHPASDALFNKHLDFAKAHHFVVAYDWSVSEYLRLKVEPYFQYLYDIPVEKDSPFSLINHRDFWMMLPLVNDGKGINSGIELTLEHYLYKGYYYLFTTSLFHSRYKGGDGVWRNTRQNRNFIFNALAGKEWKMGRQQQNLLHSSLRLTLQGCERYIPVDESASIAAHKIVYDYAHAYQTSLTPEFIGHFTLGYKMNRRKKTHEFALKVINITSYKEFDGTYYYNYRENRPEKSITSIAIPNVSYKIEF
jgi:hypothetical protein